MRDFGILNTHYWSWVKKNKLSQGSAIIGAYLLTCHHGNSLGCFVCPPEFAAFETGYDIHTVSNAYLELIKHELITYCGETGIVFFPKYMKWNKPQNLKHAVGIVNILCSLPKDLIFLKNISNACAEFLSQFMGDSRISGGITECMNTLSVPYRYKEKEKEKETDTEKDTEKEKDIKNNRPKSKNDFDLDVLPEVLNRDLIVAFIEHRKKLKKPFTQHGLVLACKDAMKCQELHGIDPNEAIERVIASGWQACNPTYFEKNSRNGPQEPRATTVRQDIAKQQNDGARRLKEKYGIGGPNEQSAIPGSSQGIVGDLEPGTSRGSALTRLP